MPNLKVDNHTYIRAAPIFVSILGILSIVELGLGITDGVQLSEEPVDSYFLRHYGRKPTST
jgi:hypothetical protein